MSELHYILYQFFKLLTFLQPFYFNLVKLIPFKMASYLKLYVFIYRVSWISDLCRLYERQHSSYQSQACLTPEGYWQPQWKKNTLPRGAHGIGLWIDRVLNLGANPSTYLLTQKGHTEDGKWSFGLPSPTPGWPMPPHCVNTLPRKDLSSC